MGNRSKQLRPQQDQFGAHPARPVRGAFGEGNPRKKARKIRMAKIKARREGFDRLTGRLKDV